MVGTTDTQVETLTMKYDNNATSATYKISSPAAGTEVRHWLGQPSVAANIWKATPEFVKEQKDGHNLDDIDYAIGPMNNIRLRTAADDGSEPVTIVHQILLYDVSGGGAPELKPFMVTGRTYFVVADFTTNVLPTTATITELREETELIVITLLTNKQI